MNYLSFTKYRVVFGYGLLFFLMACPTGVDDNQPSTDAGNNNATPPLETQDAGSRLHPPLEISGFVVDENDLPVHEAWVMQGGRSDEKILTAEDGSFTIVLEDPGYGISVLVATKPGYRATGEEYFVPGVPITLKIRAINPPDNEEYLYQDPGDGSNIEMEDCTHCHAIFVRQFLDSKHSQAARSPLMQDLYAGVSRAHEAQESCEAAGGNWRQGLTLSSEDTPEFKCYLGGGVLGDLNDNCGGDNQSSCDDPAGSAEEAPTAFGSCADCHAPGINGVAGGRNLHDATGLAYEKGVHCDMCHKVRDIDMVQPPGVGQRLVMGRPSEEGRNSFVWYPVYFGPLIDVPLIAMSASYQPKFSQAIFCAGCHQQEQPALLPGESLDAAKWPGGLPVHTTYSEWERGPYRQSSTACQFCHMPETFGRANSTDLATVENQSISNGFPRDPEENRQHTFRGPLHGEPRLIDSALYASIVLAVEDQTLQATVSVANVGCGHAVPTGEPMRSLVMVVEAKTESCGELKPMAGMTLPDTAGALAHGIEGSDTTTTGTTMTWSVGATIAAVGQAVRVTRPTGIYDDYAATGYFGNEALSAEQKGLEVFAPVGEALIQSIDGSVITLNTELNLQTGDHIYLGDAWPENAVDGQDALHLAGKAGYAFSKVLVDSVGNRHVPHYKALDMVSDNRIPPGGRALTEHSFELPAGCGAGQVSVKVFYRPVPLGMANLRGWEAKDYLIVSAQEDIP